MQSEADVLANPTSLSLHGGVWGVSALWKSPTNIASKKSLCYWEGLRYNRTTGVNGTRYYKLNLVRTRGSTGRGKETFRSHFDVIRNHHYVVAINGINSDGFKTFWKRRLKHHWNNVFADTKLKRLSEDFRCLFNTYCRPYTDDCRTPGTYHIAVDYLVKDTSGNRKETLKYIKYYPSWDAKERPQSKMEKWCAKRYGLRIRQW